MIFVECFFELFEAFELGRNIVIERTEIADENCQMITF